MKKIFNSKLSKISNPQKAFTLLELLIVIAVLGILAVAIITALNPVKKINQTKDSNVKSDMNQIANALQAYIANQNPPNYPPTANLYTSGFLTPVEIKTVPMQQNGTEYNYLADNASVPPVAVLWGSMYDDSTKFWCWDSIKATFKPVSTTPVPTTAGC